MVKMNRQESKKKRKNSWIILPECDIVDLLTSDFVLVICRRCILLTLTKEDLSAIGDLLDAKLEEKLETKLEEKLETKLEEKLETKLEEKLETKLDVILEEKFKPVYERLDNLDNRLTKLELHIENVTDENIKLLLENHIALVNKLNESIKTFNISTLYEVKVNILADEVEKLKERVNDLDSRIA